MDLDPYVLAALLAGVALLCGLAPQAMKLSERKLHVLLGAATGIFLGAVFLELLPRLDLAAAHDGHDHEGHDHGGASRVWLCVLCGLLAVYLVESLFLRSRDADDRHRHKAVAWAALLGLSLQALISGVALSAKDSHSRGASVFAILHVAAQAFALGTVFDLAQIRRARAQLAITVFAALMPCGLAVAEIANLSAQPATVSLLAGFAAGIFLFVSLCELLPEVFHHREDALLKVLLLALGIGAVAAR